MNIMLKIKGINKHKYHVLLKNILCDILPEKNQNIEILTTYKPFAYQGHSISTVSTVPLIILLGSKFSANTFSLAASIYGFSIKSLKPISTNAILNNKEMIKVLIKNVITLIFCFFTTYNLNLVSQINNQSLSLILFDLFL